MGVQDSRFDPWGVRPAIRAYGNARGADFEAHAFGLLQVRNNLKQISGLGVAAGTEHAHPAFR
jgi:hypothetical protein